MAEIAELFRYPVKGLSPERLSEMELTVDLGLACDRDYAIALGTTRFDPENPEPLDKDYFLMLRNNEELAALETSFDPGKRMLTIGKDGAMLLEADLGTAEGRDAVETFFERYIGPAAKGRPKLVQAEGHKFTDASVVSPVFMRSVSIINMASVRALEEATGRSLHPLRFRGNIYLEGLEPWEEFGWVDREFSSGEVSFRGLARTPRCGAVNVNPVTARRDSNLPKAIMQNFGHTDLGVFAEVIAGGTIKVGDRLGV